MKPGRSWVWTGVLAGRLAPAPGRLERRLAGVQAGRELDQLHELCRQAEVHADHPVLPAAARRDLGDRERRGVRREDRFFRTHLVQRSEQLLLDREVLEHRLDHEIAGAKFIYICRLDEIPDNLLELLARELAALDRLREESFGLAAGTLKGRSFDVVGDRGKTCARSDDRDARPHGAARAGNADRPDRPAHRSTKLRPISWRWIWLVPSQIWVILASRISRSTRWSLQ